MYKELLLELGCEEIPASWLPALSDQLDRVFTARLGEARVSLGSRVEPYSTPRRLVLRIGKLADRQTDLAETTTGPAVTSAYDAGGAPTPAALGFARKHGVRVTDLTRVATPKGEYLTVEKHQLGEPTAVVLPGVLAATLRDLSFPKQMYWDAWLDDGRGDLPFGRPIRWILYLYGGRVVPFEIRRSELADALGVEPVRSGAITHGHRFLAPRGRPGRSLRVRSFDDYRRKLNEHYVVLERHERADLIARALDAQASQMGGRLWTHRETPSLLQEVPDLVEYPAVIAGTFPAEFLDLPDEVLTTTMIHHQHFFPIANEAGRLMPAFLAVVNTEPSGSDIIARNAERVLTARLRDARFFWNADKQITLASRIDRLETIAFHKVLGSYGAKAERLARLARWIATDALGRPDLADAAERAARLAKTDLTTEMVGELPELQGIMGGLYARDEGEQETIWKAIYHQYLPIGAETDAVPGIERLGPAAGTWAAVALADRMDTVVGLFSVGEEPTGSRDPLGLRRQALGIVRILVDLPALTGIDRQVPLASLIHQAGSGCAEFGSEVAERVRVFVRERLMQVMTSRGLPVGVVRAVTFDPRRDGTGKIDISPLRAVQVAQALQDSRASMEFEALTVLFKRVKNIAKQLEEAARPDRAVLGEPAEVALLDAVDRQRPAIARAVAAGDYVQAFAEIGALRPAVDRFFTEVFVMVDEPRVRTARLALMAELRDLVLELADISEVAPQTDAGIPLT